MKTFFALASLALAVVSCSKDFRQESPLSDAESREIHFNVDESFRMEIATRSMSERNSVSGFTCLALTSDNSILVDNMTTVCSGTGETLPGKYWPVSGNCSFFGVLPNVAMSNSSGTVTFPVGSPSSKLDGSEDCVFASTRNAMNGHAVPMIFNHILSNVAGLRLSGEKDGTSTTVESITLSHPRYGTYRCASAGDSWIGLGPEEITELSTDFRSSSHPSGPVIEGRETGSSADDLSIIPGTWTLRFQYSVTAGQLARSYDKSAQVSFAAGKKNTISATLTNDIKMLDVSLTVQEWDSGNTATAWVEDFKSPIDFNGFAYVDLGLPSGTLWAKNTYVSGTYAKVAYGSSYQADFPAGDPAYDPVTSYMGGDWRTPTKEEAQELLDHCSVAQVYNGQSYDILVQSNVNGNYILLRAYGSYDMTSISIWTASHYMGELSWAIYLTGQYNTITKKQLAGMGQSMSLPYLGVIAGRI